MVDNNYYYYYYYYYYYNKAGDLCAVCRKADLRELKRLHVQENRLMQALASRALAAKEEQMKKFEIDKQVSVYMCILYVVCAWFADRKGFHLQKVLF